MESLLDFSLLFINFKRNIKTFFFFNFHHSTILCISVAIQAIPKDPLEVPIGLRLRGSKRLSIDSSIYMG
jgi:hypothetical protein